MDASDPISPKLLCHGGRPHMGPGFRQDDVRYLATCADTASHFPFCLAQQSV